MHSSGETCAGRGVLCVTRASALLALLTAGCAAPSLPLQHVVVYRNGIAYFERAGHVGADEVRFKMEQAKIGDFLATLAVTERGGRSVRTAALPIRQDDSGADAARGLRTVTLALDGKGHDLQVGYVTEAPLWKPSYRMVVHDGGQAELQAWGIVQNLSGEDWKDVRLSLASGAPIAFESDLDSTGIPSRPMVTDPGQSNGSVPRGDTTLAQGAAQSMGGGMLFSDAAAFARAQGGRALLDQALQSAQVSVSASGAFRPNSAREPAPPFTPRRPVGTLTVQGASSRYDVEAPAVFLGQGLLDAVPAGATATVPFALEGGIAVERGAERKADETGARIAKIENGELTVDRDAVTLTTYRLRNGTDQPSTVRVKHERAAATRLFGAPAGTEDNLGARTALVPVTVPAHAAAQLVVDERAARRKACDWLSPLADEAVRTYFADAHADPKVAKAPSAAWGIRDDYLRATNDRDSLRQQAYTLSQATEEERKNMRSIERSNGVDALR